MKFCASFSNCISFGRLGGGPGTTRVESSFALGLVAQGVTVSERIRRELGQGAQGAAEVERSLKEATWCPRQHDLEILGTLGHWLGAQVVKPAVFRY